MIIGQATGHGMVTEMCQVRTCRALQVSLARLLIRERGTEAARGEGCNESPTG